MYYYKVASLKATDRLTEEQMRVELADPRYRVVGLKQTLKAIRSGSAELVYLTRDAQPEMTEQVRAEAVLRGIPVETVSSMEALGKACRIQAKAAAAAKLRADKHDYIFPGVEGIL